MEFFHFSGWIFKKKHFWQKPFRNFILEGKKVFRKLFLKLKTLRL